MNYNEFINAVLEYVGNNEEWDKFECTFLPKGYSNNQDREEQELIYATNIKYFSVESDVLKGDFLVLKRNKSGETACFSRFSMEHLFEEYQRGSWDRIRQIIQENIALFDLEMLNDFVANIGDYETIREKLIIRPINYTDNRYELKNVVHKTIGDIALVLYGIIYDDHRGLGTTKITKEILESWEKDPEEVWEEAMINTNIYALPRMYMTPLELVNPPFSLGAFMAVDSKIKKLLSAQVPTITTTKKINGAIAMFYPGVKEKIAELFGSSYYVAFTGTCDVRVHHKDSTSPRNVLARIKSMNKDFPQELLSRKVYYYDKETRELTMLEL